MTLFRIGALITLVGALSAIVCIALDILTWHTLVICGLTTIVGVLVLIMTDLHRDDAQAHARLARESAEHAEFRATLMSQEQITEALGRYADELEMELYELRCVEDKADATTAEVAAARGEAMRATERFDRAYAAAQKAGYTVHDKGDYVTLNCTGDEDAATQ